MINLKKQLQLNNYALKGFAIKLTGNTADADDLYQDTLVRILMNKSKFETGSNFKAWAITIMRNLFINEYRKKVRRRTIVNYQPQHFYKNTDAKIFNLGENNLVYEDLSEMVDNLSQSFRIPFLMVYQGYKYDEIAELINVPLGTVKSRVFFARKKLMRMYNNAYSTRA